MKRLNWGPDSLACSCPCGAWICWLGCAKLPRALAQGVSPVPKSKKTGELQLWYLVLAYDGTDFAGWQRQAEGVRTLQGEVEKALSLVFRAEIRTVGASRTDTGVHALGQVCHFEAPIAWGDGHSAEHGALEPKVALRRLRLTLPTSLFARQLGGVESGFHARLSAVRKRYVYRLSVTSDVLPFEARRSWLCGALDLTATREAVNALSGREMDYSAFTTGENEPEYHGSVVKTVDLEMRILPAQVFIEASCERFLYKMVRRIVGALVEVGKGRLKAESIASASRRQIPTAPPQGLSLEEVVYPDDIQQAMGFG
ncbi:unnamed protein product [Effrenium voratum]|nr:unnamed protein product [Effrenium voratum]